MKDAPDRITIRTQIHHQHPGEDPVSIERGFDLLTDEIDQPYMRKITVGEDWVSIEDGCWLNSIGWLKIENRTGEGNMVNPSAEERASREKAIVIVGHPTSAIAFEIPAGQDFGPVKLASGSPLLLRCQEGSASVRLYLYPR